MSRWAVIPTRFDRATLSPLIAAIREMATPIVVHTEPGHAPIKGTVTVRSESLSIQKWWNDGLDLCDGPTLVLNDDIEAGPFDLLTLFEALDQNDVVYLAGHRVGHPTPLTGWCFGVQPDVIRPDNDFQWWYGDDDLYRRAVRDGLRIEAVDVPGIVHHRVAEAFANPVHAAMVDSDAKLFSERWP